MGPETEGPGTPLMSSPFTSYVRSLSLGTHRPDQERGRPGPGSSKSGFEKHRWTYLRLPLHGIWSEV